MEIQQEVRIARKLVEDAAAIKERGNFARLRRSSASLTRRLKDLLGTFE